MHWRLLAGIVLIAMLISAPAPDVRAEAATGNALGLVMAHKAKPVEFGLSDLAAAAGTDHAIAARGDGGLVLWDLSSGSTKSMEIPPGVRVLTADVVDDLHLVGGADGQVHGLDPEKAEVDWSRPVLGGPISVTAVSQYRAWIAFLGLDSRNELVVSVMDTAHLEMVDYWSLDIPQEMADLLPTSALWAPDGAIPLLSPKTPLLIGTGKGEVVAWCGSGAFLQVADLESTVVGLGWHGTEGRLIAVTSDGRIYLVDLADGSKETIRTTDYGSGGLTSFDMEGDRMAVGGTDGQVEVWDLNTLKHEQTVRYHKFSVVDVCWRDTDHLLTGSTFGEISLFGPDGDGDGIADVTDVFPDDFSEQFDSDNDGVGDNRDLFPQDPTEWADSDGDGVGDNGDAFPKDVTEWADSDGDGAGDNGDFIPGMHNTWAAVLFVGGVAIVGAVPAAVVVRRQRGQRRLRRQDAQDYLRSLGLDADPGRSTSLYLARLDTVSNALDVWDAADPPMLRDTIEARETTTLNTMVALRVQEEIISRDGVGADAAMARAVELRDQLQELDGEREQLEAIVHQFSKVQKAVDDYVVKSWPELVELDETLEPLKDRINVLENTLEQFRRSSIIKIGDEASQISRGAYVVAAKEVGVKGTARPVGVKVGEVPAPDDGMEEESEAPAVPLGRLRTRQAMLLREDTAELVVSVDNTLAQDLEELAFEFDMVGDRLRHKGPHRIELGTLATGRSAAATFQMNVLPLPTEDYGPGEATRVLVHVSAMAGGQRLRQDLPSKATDLVSSDLHRPAEWQWVPIGEGTVGRRGVRFPHIPSKVVLEALEYPQGMIILMEGDLDGGGTWRVFISRTEADEPLAVITGVAPGAEWTDLTVEVRGPPRFPARELAEELVDTVRFSVLSDKRLRPRGEDQALDPGATQAMAKKVADQYLGSVEEAEGNGPAEG